MNTISAHHFRPREEVKSSLLVPGFTPGEDPLQKNIVKREKKGYKGFRLYPPDAVRPLKNVQFRSLRLSGQGQEGVLQRSHCGAPCDPNIRLEES